ncbi:16633_t:CDS:2, partial [Dentiscutata erythropus]
DLMISTYIPQVIWTRPNGFFKSKGIIFVDMHHSHVYDDVIRALNVEGLDIIEIPENELDGWRKEKEDTPKIAIHKKHPINKFATGLMLDPDGSEDYKILNRLQAIVENCLNKLSIEDMSSRDESSPSNSSALHNDELDNTGSDDDDEDIMDDDDIVFDSTNIMDDDIFFDDNHENDIFFVGNEYTMNDNDIVFGNSYEQLM